MLCSGVILFSISACSGSGNSPEEQIINYNIDNEPVTLDPQIADDSGARLVILNIFEGLVRIDADGNAVEGVAENWEISDNNTVYTFHLRKNAQWNNGTKLTADDFVFGIRRSLLPETGSSTAQTLYCIKNAEAVAKGRLDSSTLGIYAINENTLKIELEYPYSGFLSLLATAPAMPCNQEFFDSVAGQYGRDYKYILSNGAFYVRDYGWSHNEYIYLRKNTKYNGKDKPIPAGVDLTIGKSFDDICDAVSSNTVDCYSIPVNDVERAEKLNLNLISFGDTIWGISFNTQDSVLKNTDIRCGLLSSLDRNYILKSIPFNCTDAHDIIPDSAKVGDKSYRSVAGNSLYIKKSDKAKATFQKGLKSLKLDGLPKTTIVCSNDAATQSIVNNIIETWNKVTGTYINKKPVSRSSLDDAVTSGDYQIIITPLTVDGDNPLNTLELFSSKNKNNISRLSDIAYDNYIETIRQNPNESALLTMIDAETYLNENGIFYPLYLEKRYYASAENVSGIIFHPYGAEADFFYAKKIEK